MTSELHTSPHTDTRKIHSEWVSTRRKTNADEVREFTECPMTSDIGSPHDSPTSSHYNGESLDFGDSSVDII